MSEKTDKELYLNFDEYIRQYDRGQETGEWHLDIRDSKSARDARLKNILRDQNDINESTRAQLDAISTALTELQAKEPRKRDRRPIGFIVPDEKKGWNARLYLMFDGRCNKS